LVEAEIAVLANFAKNGRLSTMPTRNISLTSEQDAFVDEIVKAGEYQNASEAVRDALRALQQRRKQDELKLELLRAQIEVGVSALNRGDATELEEGELEAYLVGLGAHRARRARRKRARLTMARFRISAPARADLEHILATSLDRWGEAGRSR
jgi:antitoxin ParD1/3/4